MSDLQLCNKNNTDHVYMWILLNLWWLGKETTSNFHLFELQKINFPTVGLELADFLLWQHFVPSHHLTHNITVTFHIVTGCSWAE